MYHRRIEGYRPISYEIEEEQFCKVTKKICTSYIDFKCLKLYIAGKMSLQDTYTGIKRYSMMSLKKKETDKN